jgi:hypothetical protein
MSFLKEERGGLLKKRWNLVLEKWFSETLPLVSRWIPALGGASEISHPLGGNLAVTSPNTFVGAPVGSLGETALLDPEIWRCRVSPRRQGSPQ